MKNYEYDYNPIAKIGRGQLPPSYKVVILDPKHEKFE